MNTQIGNADQRSIYVNSPNKCKLQMVALILMKEIHIFLQLSHSFAGAMTSQTLFLAMVCIECVDVGKDNSHTVIFFICLLRITLTVCNKCYIYFYHMFLFISGGYHSRDKFLIYMYHCDEATLLK